MKTGSICAGIPQRMMMVSVLGEKCFLSRCVQPGPDILGLPPSWKCAAHQALKQLPVKIMVIAENAVVANRDALQPVRHLKAQLARRHCTPGRGAKLGEHGLPDKFAAVG